MKIHIHRHRRYMQFNEKMDIDRFSLYPDPEAGKLVHGLEHYYNLQEGQVFVGVGSDDVLALGVLTFFNSGKPILFPDITYSFYPVWAQVYRIRMSVRRWMRISRSGSKTIKKRMAVS